jgi:hypothetical protein
MLSTARASADVWREVFEDGINNWGLWPAHSINLNPYFPVGKCMARYSAVRLAYTFKELKKNI